MFPCLPKLFLAHATGHQISQSMIVRRPSIHQQLRVSHETLDVTCLAT